MNDEVKRNECLTYALEPSVLELPALKPILMENCDRRINYRLVESAFYNIINTLLGDAL